MMRDDDAPTLEEQMEAQARLRAKWENREKPADSDGQMSAMGCLAIAGAVMLSMIIAIGVIGGWIAIARIF